MQHSVSVFSYCIIRTIVVLLLQKCWECTFFPKNCSNFLLFSSVLVVPRLRRRQRKYRMSSCVLHCFYTKQKKMKYSLSSWRQLAEGRACLPTEEDASSLQLLLVFSCLSPSPTGTSERQNFKPVSSLITVLDALLMSLLTLASENSSKVL